MNKEEILMKKKVLSMAIIMCMALSMAACGSKENVSTNEEVESSSVMETEEDISEEVVSSEVATEESVESETPTPESTEAPVEEATPEPYTYTELDQIMYAKQTVNIRSIPSADGEKLGSLNLNDEVHVTGQCVEIFWYRIEYNGGIGYISNNYLVSEKIVGGNTSNDGNNGNNGGNETPSSETSTTPPVVNPEPTNPPASSGNGDNLSFSGSVNLPSGLTISTLDEFNGAGMDTSAGNSFMGDIYSDIVAQNYETMADNFDAFNSVWPNSAINVTNGEQIWWRSDLSNMSASLELRRCGDHYKIIIRGPHLDNATAESMGWNIGNSGHDDAREALTVLLSTISSRPQELQNAIIQTIYTAPAGQEPIDTNGNWTSIGDCRIRLGAYDFENGNHEVIFRIAP